MIKKKVTKKYSKRKTKKEKELEEVVKKQETLFEELLKLQEKYNILKLLLITAAIVIFLYWLDLPNKPMLASFINDSIMYIVVLSIVVFSTIFFVPSMYKDLMEQKFGDFIAKFFIWFLLGGAWILMIFFQIFIW